MKARGIAALLMTLALVASSAVVADAGGGQGSSVNATLLDCYVIENGTNSPYVLTLVDQFGTRGHVRVGQARLLCTQTTAATVERGPVLNGDFDPNAADHIKCYGASSPLDTGADAVVTINDPFGAETVKLNRLVVLCTPATKDVVP